MNAAFEVVVVGGGLTGACAAALLARHAGIAPERIALLSAELPASPPSSPSSPSSPLAPLSPSSSPPSSPSLRRAPPELRVAAISRASEYVLRAAGAWERLDGARVCAYEHMCVWHESAAADGPGALRFDAADLGEPNLGYIVENGALQRACLESFRAAGGVVVAATLETLAIEADAARLQCPGHCLTARLVVGADGAQSAVREHVGLPVRVHDYRQLAIVATIATERAHAHTAWQRFLRTGPLALLPLFDGCSSIVWSADGAAAQLLLDCEPHEFEARLDAASAGVLGATRLCSERARFALRSLAAQSYVRERCALIGDAAHVIHPLAGQGANLGLLDAAALCEAIAPAPALHEDPGALRLLRHYEQQRRTHNLAMDAAMSLFQAGFAAARGPVASLLNRGVGMVDRSAALKRLLAQRALGTAGELPRLARARAA